MINHTGDWTYILMIGAMIVGGIVAVVLLLIYRVIPRIDPQEIKECWKDGHKTTGTDNRKKG